jgi:hypothetical protein
MKAAFAALLLSAYVDTPQPSFRAIRHYDLAFLTHQEAWDLHGQRIVCRVDLDSRPEMRHGYIAYDCASPDDVYRAVWLRRGQQIEDTMTVEATLRLRYFPPDPWFDGFWEYRLVDAVRR